MVESDYILSKLSTRMICFTYDDLLSWFGEEQIEASSIVQDLEKGKDFIRIKLDTFISKNALAIWLARLNSHLAKSKTFKTDIPAFRKFARELQPNGHLIDEISDLTLEFGSETGLAIFQARSDKVVFPIAYLLSFLNKTNLAAFSDLSNHLYELQKVPSEELIVNTIEKVLNDFELRERDILVKRLGLFGNSKLTLEGIGNLYDITRERVRQIENKSLRKLYHPSRQRKLLAPLIIYLCQNRGNLIITPGVIEQEILFLAKLLGIPISILTHTGKYLLGQKEDILQTKGENTRVDLDIIANTIDQKYDIPLTTADLVSIASIMKDIPRHLTKQKKAYLVLKEIGRPAHYSEVADAYELMFPGEYVTEHSIHALLQSKKHGVVWTGVKGKYALKEWGYTRPSSTLMQRIATIVEERYRDTGIPVPLVAIQAEIGKYRKLVNPNSVTMAAYFNPRLQSIDDSSFIPKIAATINENKKSAIDVDIDRLDQLLRKFEDNTGTSG